MNNLSKYRFERLSANNLHHLITLFKLVFNKNITLQELIKKYDTSYLGVQYLGHIAFEGNQPVAYGGYIPCMFQWGSQKEIGAQAVDLMSINKVRGKGVFAEIWHLNDHILKLEGIHFCYAFANQLSEPVLVKKFNWKLNSRMSVFIIRPGGFHRARYMHKLQFHKSVNKRINKTIAKNLLHSNINNPFTITELPHVLYNQDFFDYKSTAQHFSIQIDGLEIWLKAGNVLTVGTMSNCSADQMQHIVKQLTLIAEKIGYHRIIFQFSPNTLHSKNMSTFIQPIVGTAIVYKNINSSFPLDNMLFSASDIDTF